MTWLCCFHSHCVFLFSHLSIHSSSIHPAAGGDAVSSRPPLPIAPRPSPRRSRHTFAPAPVQSEPSPSPSPQPSPRSKHKKLTNPFQTEDDAKPQDKLTTPALVVPPPTDTKPDKLATTASPNKPLDVTLPTAPPPVPPPVTKTVSTELVSFLVPQILPSETPSKPPLKPDQNNLPSPLLSSLDIIINSSTTAAPNLSSTVSTVTKTLSIDPQPKSSSPSKPTSLLSDPQPAPQTLTQPPSLPKIFQSGPGTGIIREYSSYCTLHVYGHVFVTLDHYVLSCINLCFPNCFWRGTHFFPFIIVPFFE